MNAIYLSFIIFLNVTLLVILVPGGPIENRDFTALKGFVFWGFNVFLVSLGLVTFYASYAVLANLNSAAFIAKCSAVSYIAVYGLDLAGIFPKSPTKMSKTLMLLELINLCVAVYMFILATQI